MLELLEFSQEILEACCGCAVVVEPKFQLWRSWGKNHGIFKYLLRQLYLLHKFWLSVTSDTTEAFSKEFPREV